MEKLQSFVERQFRSRLLKIACVLFASASHFVFSITPQEIRELVITAEKTVCFANQEVKYVLEIPEVGSGDVQTQLQTLKDGVTFISSRRMEYFTGGGKNGTRIEFWFSFANPGEPELPPLIVRIRNTGYYIPFEKIHIYENPKTILPHLIVELNNGMLTVSPENSAGAKPASFTCEESEPVDIIVYIQHAVQVKQFGYEIPKDSLFDEIMRYEIVTGKKLITEFSTEKIPVAKFRWIPLRSGSYPLPNIRVVAAAYNGRSVELELPPCTVTVKKPELKSGNDNADFPVFAYALANPFADEPGETHKPARQEDFYNIAKLRSRERRSFGPSPSVTRERILLEQSIGISRSLKEGSIPLYYTVAALFAFSLICAFILFILKRKVSAVVSSVFALLFLSACFFAGAAVHEKHAVVKGGAVCPIPEDSALSSISIAAGTCVCLKEQTPDWYYIEYNESGGWIKKENVILVE